MGMMIIILGILLFLFSPKIQDLFLTETKNPSSFIQDCIEEDISLAVNVLSLNGGSINPEHYFVYDGSRLEYLCYIEGFYQTCVVQQPMLKRHIEMEIEKAITQKSEECFADLKESYERKGYQVSLSKGEIDVELLPQKIVTTFNNSLTLTKESTESYKSVRVVINNNLYEVSSYQKDKTIYGILLKIPENSELELKFSYLLSDLLKTNNLYYQFYFQKQPGDKISSLDLSFASSKLRISPYNFISQNKDNSVLTLSTDTSVDRIFQLRLPLE